MVSIWWGRLIVNGLRYCKVAWKRSGVNSQLIKILSQRLATNGHRSLVFVCSYHLGLLKNLHTKNKIHVASRFVCYHTWLCYWKSFLNILIGKCLHIWHSLYWTFLLFIYKRHFDWQKPFYVTFSSHYFAFYCNFFCLLKNKHCHIKIEVSFLTPTVKIYMVGRTGFQPAISKLTAHKKVLITLNVSVGVLKLALTRLI